MMMSVIGWTALEKNLKNRAINVYGYIIMLFDLSHIG